MGKLLRRRNILHRGMAAALGVLLLLTPGLGQRRRHDLPIPETPTKKVKGPRALALVEWPAPPSTGAASASGGATLGPRPRLIPVAILIEGHYYDASIYKASPVPMALDPGTVYEVEQSGESVGVVTLESARVLGEMWWADARFQSKEALARASARRAERDRPAPPPAEGPPRLRRGPASSTGSQTAPSAAPAQQTPPADDDEGRPVLRRRGTDADSAPPAASDTPAKSASAPATAAAPATAPAPEQAQSDDSGRPVLRRGSTGKEQAQTLPGSVEVNARPQTSTAKSGATGTTKPGAVAPATPPASRRVLVAISDEGGPEPRSFVYTWDAPRQQKLTAAMEKLAVAALQEYARAHPGQRPGPLQDVQVRAFDLAFNNEPDLVLMASAQQLPPVSTPTPRRPVTKGAKPVPEAAPAPPADLTFWVTVVAREDYNGELRKQKVAVTDSKHLDAFSRLELIDAVDADGDGRGELLFREVSDVGQNYVLYRVNPDQLTQLYNSSRLQQ